MHELGHDGHVRNGVANAPMFLDAQGEGLLRRQMLRKARSKHVKKGGVCLKKLIGFCAVLFVHLSARPANIERSAY
jgi:hypothetical protein